jgi:hypothetical protein
MPKNRLDRGGGTGRNGLTDPDLLFDKSPNRRLYVVVAPKPSGPQSFDEYVGVVTSESQIAIDGDRIAFVSGHSWGNNSTVNSVVIQFDKSNLPIRAAGTSDLRNLTCEFHNK